MSALALVLAAAASQAPQPPTFRVGVESVYVDVFVTDDYRPVVGLTASDFELRGHHELEVKLVRRKGQVHSRKAYVVGPAAH